MIRASPHLVLDAAQVQQVEVAGKPGHERGEGLQRRDAASFGHDGKRQHLVVEDSTGHVAEYGGEARRGAVRPLQERRDGWKRL